MFFNDFQASRVSKSAKMRVRKLTFPQLDSGLIFYWFLGPKSTQNASQKHLQNHSFSLFFEVRPPMHQKVTKKLSKNSQNWYNLVSFWVVFNIRFKQKRKKQTNIKKTNWCRNGNYVRNKEGMAISSSKKTRFPFQFITGL